MKINDSEAYRLLKKYGISIADFALAKDLEEARLSAGNIGYPLYLKIDSPVIIHKKNLGCVLKVRDEGKIDNAFRLVINNAKKMTKNINGVIVQKSVDGFESIAGVKCDGQFGHVIMFGSGGPMTEFLNDTSFRLVPISEIDARSMIADTKAGKYANGSVIDALLKLSKLIEENNEIKELDINPLMIGESAIAADVRVIVG